MMVLMVLAPRTLDGNNQEIFFLPLMEDHKTKEQILIGPFFSEFVYIWYGQVSQHTKQFQVDWEPYY